MHRREFTHRLIQSSLALLIMPSKGFGTGKLTVASFPIKNIPPGFAIASLGNEYLRIFPEFGARTVLLDGIFGPECWDGGSRRIFNDEISATGFLADSIARDFDRDATLRIGGWVYAEMELKPCAWHCIAVA